MCFYFYFVTIFNLIYALIVLLVTIITTLYDLTSIVIYFDCNKEFTNQSPNSNVSIYYIHKVHSYIVNKLCINCIIGRGTCRYVVHVYKICINCISCINGVMGKGTDILCIIYTIEYTCIT